MKWFMSSWAASGNRVRQMWSVAGHRVSPRVTRPDPVTGPVYTSVCDGGREFPHLLPSHLTPHPPPCQPQLPTNAFIVRTDFLQSQKLRLQIVYTLPIMSLLLLGSGEN